MHTTKYSRGHYIFVKIIKNVGGQLKRKETLTGKVNRPDLQLKLDYKWGLSKSYTPKMCNHEKVNLKWYSISMEHFDTSVKTRTASTIIFFVL